MKICRIVTFALLLLPVLAAHAELPDSVSGEFQTLERDTQFAQFL